MVNRFSITRVFTVLRVPSLVITRESRMMVR